MTRLARSIRFTRSHLVSKIWIFGGRYFPAGGVCTARERQYGQRVFSSVTFYIVSRRKRRKSRSAAAADKKKRHEASKVRMLDTPRAQPERPRRPSRCAALPSQDNCTASRRWVFLRQMRPPEEGNKATLPPTAPQRMHAQAPDVGRQGIAKTRSPSGEGPLGSYSSSRNSMSSFLNPCLASSNSITRCTAVVHANCCHSGRSEKERKGRYQSQLTFRAKLIVSL